jgi:hypothetical protein
VDRGAGPTGIIALTKHMVASHNLRVAGANSVHVRQVITAPKANIRVGAWQNGKVPRADFPISRKAYRLGSSFEWSVIKFEALGRECRVLVAFNAAKEKYQATLGVMAASGDLRILASYEYHAAEPGWHLHVCCDDDATLSPGILRGPWVRRIPGGRKKHKRVDFAVDDQTRAIRVAVDRYRIETQGSLI